METLTLERTLTELDHVRLSKLLRRDAQAAQAMENLLDGCAVVPSRQVAADVATMGSQLLIADLATGRRSTLTLCYPDQAEPAVGLVSVLSPVGSALLGMAVGGVARWATPAGDEMAAELLAVLYQPEASGDFTT